jgi:hypothetical protein
MLLVQSCVTVGVTSNPITKARSLLGLENLEQELGGRLLLELKARADRGAGVDDDAHAHGQIDLLVKGVHPGRRLLVVEQGKVALLQVGNVVPVLVSHREDEVDLVDAEVNHGGRSHRLALRRLPGCGGV